MEENTRSKASRNGRTVKINIREFVMYVAKDLEHWLTDEPHLCADKVTIFDKEFIRLTPSAVTWFKERIVKAESACAAGKLPLEHFTHIVQAFCPVYAFAVRVGMVPDLVAALHEES